MNTESIITSMVNTLLHSLWQAPLIAILLYISIAGLKLTSRSKYVLSFLSLFIVLTVSISTFIYFSNPYTSITGISKGQATTLSMTDANVDMIGTSGVGSYFYIIEEYAELIFILWLTGVMIFLIKFGLDLYYANTIKKKEYTKIDEVLLYRFRSIAEKMGVQRSVDIFESALIKVPVVIGHFKPVILLPLGLVTKIPNDQIEAIISHELAHIIRNDFLHNLIQSVIEIIYFFNPAIYFISKQIRTERENCCDDLALKHCSDCANLAKGLYNLQKMQGNVPKPIMAAINKGDLLSRIKRIIGKEKDMKNSYTGFIASIIVMTLALTFITGCSLFAGAKDEVKTEEANVIIVKKSSDGEDVKMDVYVTDAGNEDMDKQIFITTTDDGKIIKKIIETKNTGDLIEKRVEVLVTQDGDSTKTISVTTDGDENVWINKDGEKHIVKNNGKKMIFINGDDFADLSELDELSELDDIDMDIDIDIDIDFDEIAKSLEEALKEIDKKDLTDEQKAETKAKVKEAIEKLKSEEYKVKAEVKAAKAEAKAQKLEQKERAKALKLAVKHAKKDIDLSKIKLIEKIDTDNIREELVKDGIISKNNEELKIFIDDDVIKINDKEIPEKHKAKYKKMLEGM